MEKILVISATEKSANALSDLLVKAGGHPSPFSCTSGARARRLLLDEGWDTVIINLPLIDDDGVEIARLAATECDASVIAMVRENEYGDFSALLSDAGVILVTKPVIMPIFTQALSLGRCFKARFDALKAQNQKLQGQIEEQKLVSQAKCLLIEKRKCTEEEAHHLIERRAMNSRISRREAALAVIRLYTT